MVFVSVLADAVSRIKVAYAHRDIFVRLRYSKFLTCILDVMVNQGCLRSYSIEKDDLIHVIIVVHLKYYRSMPVIKNISLVSKPGLRIFWTIGALTKKLQRSTFQGFFLISTSCGVYTSTELLLLDCVSDKISGEIILKIDF